MKQIKVFFVVLIMCLTMSVSAFAKTPVPILLYHNVLPQYDISESIVTITPQRLEEHLTTLVLAGYTPIGIDDYINATKGTYTLPEKPIIITFDDGYTTNYTYAYPILKKHNIKATIFIAVNSVGQTPGNHPHFDWEEAREMVQSGLVNIQSHTYSHQDMTAKTLYEAERELRYSKYLIEKNLGIKCNAVAFPYGFHTEALINRAHRAGYELVLQVGNVGINTVDDKDKALVRITTFGSWTGSDLLYNIDNCLK